MGAGLLAADHAERKSASDAKPGSTDDAEPQPVDDVARTAAEAGERKPAERDSAVQAQADTARDRRQPEPQHHGFRAWYARSAPVLISRAAGLLGVLSLLDAFSPRGARLAHWFTPMLPTPARATVTAVVAVSGLLLIRIAAGLRRRKRAEWRIAVLICVAMTIADIAREERRPIEAAITLLLLAALISVRSQFTAKSDPHSAWFAGRVCTQFLAVAIGYGLICLAMPGRVIGHATFFARLREVAMALVGMFGTVNIRGDRYADAFHSTMLGFGLLIISCAILLLIRPSEPAASLPPEDETRLRGLVRREGSRDSLGYFALRRDKAVVWSASGKAAISYRVVAGVALVSGDPIGDPEAWPGAIAAYRRLIEEHGWTPAVMGCSELGATVFKREYRMSALALGDEAILSASTFGLDGRAMRGVRQACNKLERDGYRVEVRRARDIGEYEITEICDAAERWRGNAVERGFSMALSRLGDPGDDDCVIVTARHGGQLCGMLHFVPWGPSGLSLDLMRRDREAGNGLNELMIAAVMRACPALSVTRVSLNFAVFRDPLERGERIGAGPLLRARRAILILASRWWQIDSLYRFNAKFQPEWQPRFISYQSARDMPRIALAALEAEAFIVRPHRLKRLLGRA